MKNRLDKTNDGNKYTVIGNELIVIKGQGNTSVEKLQQGDRMFGCPDKYMSPIDNGATSWSRIDSPHGKGHVCPHGTFVGENGIVEMICQHCNNGHPPFKQEVLDISSIHGIHKNNNKKSGSKNKMTIDNNVLIEQLRVASSLSGHARVLEEVSARAKEIALITAEEGEARTVGLSGAMAHLVDIFARGLGKYVGSMLKNDVELLNVAGDKRGQLNLALLLISNYILTGDWALDMQADVSRQGKNK